MHEGRGGGGGGGRGEDSSSVRSACGDGGLCSQALSETNTCVFVCALPRPASSSTACLCVCGGLWLWRVYISCPLSFKFTIFKRRPAVPSFLPPHLPLQLSVFHPSILFFSVSVARSLSLSGWLLVPSGSAAAVNSTTPHPPRSSSKDPL